MKNIFIIYTYKNIHLENIEFSNNTFPTGKTNSYYFLLSIVNELYEDIYYNEKKTLPYKI